MVYHSLPCNVMVYHDLPCNITKYHGIPCNSMVCHAIPWYIFIRECCLYRCTTVMLYLCSRLVVEPTHSSGINETEAPVLLRTVQTYGFTALVLVVLYNPYENIHIMLRQS